MGREEGVEKNERKFNCFIATFQICNLLKLRTDLLANFKIRANERKFRFI